MPARDAKGKEGGEVCGWMALTMQRRQVARFRFAWLAVCISVSACISYQRGMNLKYESYVITA